MTRRPFRLAALPAALLLLAMASAAHAQDTYLAANTTIDALHSVTNSVTIGFGSLGDFSTRTNPTSPTVDLVSGGSVGDAAAAYNSSIFNINGGQIRLNAIAADNSTVNVNNGLIGVDLNAADNSIINITGGTVGSDLNASDSSTVNIYGGNILGDFFANDNGTLNFFGTGLLAPLTSTNAFGGQYSQYTLSGALSDGTNLSGKFIYIENRSTAHFTLHAVPEASSLALFGLVSLSGISLLARRKRTA